MKVKKLFFFSFVLASAVLVQHEAKLPLSNKFNGLENSCCCIMCFAEKIFFMMTCFLLKVDMFHHTMLVLNAFPSNHFRGVKFKHLPREHAPGLTLTRLK